MAEHNISSPKTTPGLSTDGGGAVGGSETEPHQIQQDSTPEKPWYILWVHSRTEKSVRDNLIHNGFEAFAATRKEVHTWRRRERRMVEKVIIPSVVFVRMEKQDRIIVERMMNVSCLMRDPARKGARSKGQDEYACISEDEIHLFRQMLEQEEADVNFTTTDFTIGEYVRIKDFPESNNKAQIVRIYNDNKTYVGLRVSFLGCAYMQVPLNRIIKIDKS